MLEQILVLGASGTVGSALVKELLARNVYVKAASRHPQSSQHPQLEWVTFDLEDPNTFELALKEVTKVFLIARPGDDQPEKLAIPFIQACQHHQIRQIVNLTAIGIENAPDFGLRKVELALEASGIVYTHLRPNWFMQIFSSGPLLSAIQHTQGIKLPLADSTVSYIHSHDIARAAAIVLTEQGHKNKAYTLTGPQALNHNEVSHLLSQAAGIPIHYQAIDETTAAQQLRQAGLSEQRTQRLLGFYRLVRQGLGSTVEPDLATLLGQPGCNFQQFAQEQAACWIPKLTP